MHTLSGALLGVPVFLACARVFHSYSVIDLGLDRRYQKLENMNRQEPVIHKHTGN